VDVFPPAFSYLPGAREKKGESFVSATDIKSWHIVVKAFGPYNFSGVQAMSTT
jgi:hypothetical protein